ncbi:MAG TPA: hypothetical protein VFD49_20780 [Candidatus Dormibacteraeota bacterium]|nr:hypothetical protein [Candidatus Dormibacteraeota bacterium]
MVVLGVDAHQCSHPAVAIRPAARRRSKWTPAAEHLPFFGKPVSSSTSTPSATPSLSPTRRRSSSMQP